jgi:hypothetical protein
MARNCSTRGKTPSKPANALHHLNPCHRPSLQTYSPLKGKRTMSAVPSFFTRPQPPCPTVRRAKAKARAKAVLTERERSAVVAYARASHAERKQMLRDQADLAEKAKLIAERKRRKVYMRHYRAMKAMGTVIL